MKGNTFVVQLFLIIVFTHPFTNECDLMSGQRLAIKNKIKNKKMGLSPPKPHSQEQDILYISYVKTPKREMPSCGCHGCSPDKEPEFGCFQTPVPNCLRCGFKPPEKYTRDNLTHGHKYAPKIKVKTFFFFSFPPPRKGTDIDKVVEIRMTIDPEM